MYLDLVFFLAALNTSQTPAASVYSLCPMSVNRSSSISVDLRGPRLQYSHPFSQILVNLWH